MYGPDDVVPPARLRVMQIIAFALIMGVMTFLVIVLVQVFGQPGVQPAVPLPAEPMVTYIAAGMFVITGVLSFVVPSIIVSGALRGLAARPKKKQSDDAAYRDDAEALLNLRQTTMIIRLALLEGAAFFSCIALMQERQTWVIGIVVVDVVLMLARFPTQNGVRAWIDGCVQQMNEMRMRGDIGTIR